MFRTGIIGWLLLTLTGCTEPLVMVEGRVTLQGENVARGTIDLIPADNTAGTNGRAVIEQGAFKLTSEMQPGRYLIRISAPQATGKKIKVEEGAPGAVGGELDELRETIPPEYNQSSTLQRELKSGKNVLDFRL